MGLLGWGKDGGIRALGGQNDRGRLPSVYNSYTDDTWTFLLSRNLQVVQKSCLKNDIAQR